MKRYLGLNPLACRILVRLVRKEKRVRSLICQSKVLRALSLTVESLNKGMIIERTVLVNGRFELAPIKLSKKMLTTILNMKEIV